MYLISNERDGKPIYDARVNTAISSFVVNQLDLDEPALQITINDPTVMVGRFQNAYAEVDQPYLEEKGIVLMRRLSGGGAVYHDRGNLMYMMKGLNQDGQAGQKHYGDYAQPILSALRDLALNVEASGRNDLLLDGHKFSGTSFYATSTNYMFGATLAFDLDAQVASQVLTPSKNKLKAHRVKSVKGRMTNLRDHLPEKYQSWTIEEFRAYLICHIFGVDDLSQVKTYQLTEADWAKVDKIVEEKFANPDWNWGQRANFDFSYSRRFPQGNFEFSANVVNGVISKAHLTGDFFAKADVSELAQALVGVDYQPTAIRQCLSEIDLEAYIPNWTVDQMIELIFDGGED